VEPNFCNLNLFAERGGEFLVSYPDFIAKALKIKMIIFDWDGVFNGGFKGDGVYSPFSEVDSMGLNMLRFGYQMLTGNILLAGIISGMDNKNTELFVRREHLDFKCLGFKDKNEGFKIVLRDFDVKPDEVAFVYDDILDLTVAEQCGLRFQVRHDAAPMFANYVKNNHLADYVTAQVGERHAVREVMELLLAAIDKYDATVDSRTHFDSQYAEYIGKRNVIVAKEYLASRRY
jgi:3-deoxy-D-manno-octulosonate 8-phosphate phosphatase (KDO 8-P phosphatase)